jgi:8-oxo-dGTP diphosphatase
VAEVFAAGTVLWRPAGGSGVELALIHRPRYDDWSLPKGKLKNGETLWAGAYRETVEETGFTPVLGRCLGRVSYPVTQPVPAIKIVDYVAARARAGVFRPNREVDSLRWLPPEEALAQLTHGFDVDIVGTFLALPPDLATILLVRHAAAGSRARWPGPDDLRPLSGTGWQQVTALRRLLPLFGAGSVHSAPLLRCVQTVQSLADDLGVPIIEEPLLSEHGHTNHEPEALARLLDLAAAGGTPVVCSQGGVIPDLLTRLGVDKPESRKGSAWLLSFTPGPRLAAADYISHP